MPYAFVGWVPFAAYRILFQAGGGSCSWKQASAGMTVAPVGVAEVCPLVAHVDNTQRSWRRRLSIAIVERRAFLVCLVDKLAGLGAFLETLVDTQDD